MMYAVSAPGTPLSSTTRPRSTCHFAIATSTYQVPSPSPLSCSNIVRFLFHFLPLPIGLGPSLLPSRFPVLSSLFSVPYSVNPLTQKKPHVVPFLSISVFRKLPQIHVEVFLCSSRLCPPGKFLLQVVTRRNRHFNNESRVIPSDALFFLRLVYECSNCAA
jgi:hypothetical protein